MVENRLQMKKLGIVITDGVGFRNFILSDFLVEAEKVFDEVAILSCLPKEVYSGFVNNSRIIELDVFEENFTTWFFRKAKEVAHLQLHRKGNFGIQDGLNANYSKSNTPRGVATRFLFQWTLLFNSEKWIQRYHNGQHLSFKNNSVSKEYKALLQSENFDLLFFTHQRPPFIAPLAYQAKKMNIKTCSFIFSWDNLASKGRMAANFDYYLVWSDLMKAELLEFYSKVRSESIEIVGTPQFEPYALDRYQMSREDFYKKFDLDSTKKTICFSCGDISTSRNDELYIETIANAITENRIGDVNFIIRTSPAEDPTRFVALKDKFSFIKWNFPKWILSREGHQEVWSQRVPTIDDVSDLRGLLEHSDLNVNMLSTMSLDFMQFDKPVINTVFGNSKNGLYDDQRFLDYVHIINIVNLKATKIAKNEIELISNINAYLENGMLDSDNRQKLVTLQVSKPLKNTGKRISETLLKWS
jgi:hypothetical protein